MEVLPHISIVSPVYKAEHIIEQLVAEIKKAMLALKCSYEIILIDDRSPDQSWEKMKILSHENPEVKSLRLSRNFGQHPAIMAGLAQAKGEWVVVMDCDLQDQPKEIVRLYAAAQEGYEIVLAKRVNRADRFSKRLGSKVFSIVYTYFTDVKYDNQVANFGIYHQKVVQSVLSICDYIKFFPLFVNLAGFNSRSIAVEHAERYAGNSSYSYGKLISLAFNAIISFSNKPLKLFVKFGLTISVLAFIVGIYYLYKALANEIAILGYSSIIVSIWFLSGVIITTIGITGIYIGKIFDQTKHRPIYIIDEMICSGN
ncbi:glycosyltransferase family 2 protein [Pedobacter sp.]|uniref:glycosyltransferase family 2 protein n=1 Tax=Pedobacter sp. TaxID=1411316 RepID=UPI003D7FCC41